MGLRTLTTAATLSLLLLTGCSSMSQSGLPDDAVIEYRFNDSSVPPQYHRSYDLIVDRENTRIVVDSYGDILADTSVPTTDAVWNSLSAGFTDVENATSASSEAGCTGGTSSSVKVIAGDATLVDIFEERCGDSPTTDVIDMWIAPARELLPPTSELAPESQD